MKTVAEKIGKKLFRCGQCNNIKKKKFMTQRICSNGYALCKNCLKAHAEVVPTPGH